MNINNSDNKIVLDKTADLLKYSNEQLLSTKLSDFSGKCYDSLYKEALQIEMCPELYKQYVNKNVFVIKKVSFKIKYDTVYGEKIGVLGSVNEFGNWNENRAVVLNWNCNNYWKGSVEIENVYNGNIEFKFVVIEDDRVKKWQDGNNNIINISNFTGNEIETEHKIKDYRYFKKTNELLLICEW